MEWQLAEAKNRFSELLTQALHHGVQRVRRRNESVVIMAEAEYRRLTGTGEAFKNYLQSIPELGDVDLSRSSSGMREANL